MCRFGFACKVIGVPDFPKMRTCVLKNANLSNLIQLADNNLYYLERMIQYCADNQIYLVRISSDIIPFASHPEKSFQWQKIFKERLKIISHLIQQSGIRVSMHPGQYTVLNALNKSVVEQSIREINWHADFLDALEVDYASKIILHIGGIYNDKSEAMQRFADHFQFLRDTVKARIVLENDEKNYTISDVINLSTYLKLPVVFDVLHHQINPPNPPLFSTLYWIYEARKSWNCSKDGRQKIHYSQQKLGSKLGAHSDIINVNLFMNFYKQIKHLDLDIMFEVKDKNLSVLKCMKAIGGNFL